MPESRDGVFQRSDRKGWFISYVDSSGRRRKRRVAASTRTQALNVLAATKVQEERNRLLGVKEQTSMSLADLMARYKAHQKSRVKGTTFARLDGVIKVLVRDLPASLAAISRKDVADFISSRSASVAPATVFKEVTILKHALKLAVEWELLHKNVAQGVKLPQATQGRTRFLSPAELKLALEHAPDWLRGPIALAVATGMRRGEVLALRWSDVDLSGRLAYLRDTKNGSLRVLALNEMACRVLTQLPSIREGGLVFQNVDPMRLTDNTRNLFQRLGIEGASFHTLRHTAASWLVMKGCDLFTVGEMLGHKTPQMTKRYSHLSPQYMQAAAAKLDGVFGEAMPNSLLQHGDAVGTKRLANGCELVQTVPMPGTENHLKQQ